MPAARTRAEQFDELVLASLARLESRWSDELDRVEVVVADVPDVDQPGHDPTRPVPLGRADPAGPAGSARLVVHRRSIEARARRPRDREEMVHRVIVETLAELLGLPPEAVDPGFTEGGD